MKGKLWILRLLLSVKAEYTAAGKAIKEAIWFKGIVMELEFEQKSITVFCDRQSAICLTKNQIHYEKTNCIDIKLHFIRLEISRGIVKLKKIYIDYNIVDMLTKILSTTKSEQCLSLFRICNN